ncbi:hypothetical protein Tco_0857327 [Tanacetum coccineum]|uniref:Aminotransferase-like plant mobile domain-containing protein n=1 Tax=Tanacetum coccineum TaxID=301880 RepID=A0ABQ5B6B9_9ASTR
MANQEQNLPQQEQPFVAAKQVSFNLEDIILNTNNEVALLYPEHINKEYFKCVSDFISKFCLRKPFTKSPNMYQEYLAEFWYSAKALENSKVSFSIPTCGIYGEVGLNTFRNAIGAHYLPHSSEYVAPPSIDVVRKWFPTIGYREEVSTKGTLKKSLLSPRWRLLMAQIIQCLGGKTGGFNQITNKDAIMLYILDNGSHIDYANIFWEDIILKLKKRQREKVVPYTRFLSLLIMHKMKENYGIDEVTLYPTQIFSVNNWALKPNQPKEPPLIAHMLDICALDKPVVFKAPKTSSRVESVSQGIKPRTKTGHKKPATSLKQPSVSSKEATKGGSSKAPNGSKTGHSKNRKEFSSAMDSNPSRPSVSTPVDTEMHKEDQQATGGPTSLGVTRHDFSTDFTVEADPGLSTPNDSIPPQQGMDEGTKSTSYDHIFAGTDLHVLTDQTKSVSEGLETVLTQPTTENGASFTAIHGDKEEASSTIKLEDLAKQVSQIQPSFKDLDSPEDDPVIIVDESDEDEPNAETEDTLLELEKNKAKAKATLLKAQPLFPNVEQLNEILVKSLQTEFSKILSSHDFSSSLPTELKDLPSKFNKLIEEIKGLKTQVHELEIELPKELKEIPTKLEDFTKAATCLTSQVAELKTL